VDVQHGCPQLSVEQRKPGAEYVLYDCIFVKFKNDLH
jgi:hypothetical protein